jgi:hypothetical protein
VVLLDIDVDMNDVEEYLNVENAAVRNAVRVALRHLRRGQRGPRHCHGEECALAPFSDLLVCGKGKGMEIFLATPSSSQSERCAVHHWPHIAERW